MIAAMIEHPNIKRHWFEYEIESGLQKTVLVVETDLALTPLAESYDEALVSQVLDVVQPHIGPTVDRVRLLPGKTTAHA